MDSLPITFPIILDLFNFSLNSSTFPSPWKLSYVTPIPKTKNPQPFPTSAQSPSSPHLSKVLERIAFDQFSFHLHNSKLMDKQAFIGATARKQLYLKCPTMSGWSSTKEWSLCSFFSILLRHSTPSATLCSCGSSLGTPSRLPSSHGSNHISLAGFNVCEALKAPIHSGRPSQQEFLRVLSLAPCYSPSSGFR